MSILVLGGQKPDLVFQKQYNTFAKRHHLRIFHRPSRFQNHEVWVCSATHDTGFDFSAPNRTFIHKTGKPWIHLNTIPGICQLRFYTYLFSHIPNARCGTICSSPAW